MSQDYKISIRAEASCVEDALNGLTQYCLTAGFDTQDCFYIEVALAEAVNNIIEHALRGRPDESIRIFCRMLKSTLIIELLDNGKPLLDLPLNKLPDWEKESGRGWPIIYRLMDEVTYSFEHQNRLILKKQLPAF